MASSVDISNTALSHIGASARVTSISPPDGSVEADRCAVFYPMALRAFIEMAAPHWARTRELLTESENPSNVWTYAYAVPSECIKVLRILPAGALEHLSSDFEQEEDKILTDEPEATAVFLKALDTPSRLSPIGVVAVSYLLAGLLAGATIKGRPGAQTAKAFQDMGRAYAAQAAASDANASSSTAAYTPGSIAARA